MKLAAQLLNPFFFWISWIIIPLIFILPVGAALTYEFIFERIFRKLMPEEDRLREEEKDKEYRG